jgi:hypothetical protein
MKITTLQRLKHNGNSNIDLTLDTENLMSEVKNWEVLENATCSDHRPISYDTTAEPQLTKSHKIEYVYDQHNLNMGKIGSSTPPTLPKLDRQIPRTNLTKHHR